MELCVSKAGLRSVRTLIRSCTLLLMIPSVHFPGAVNSKFTTDLAFEHPSTHPAMPTYRVMDSDGIIVDESRRPSDVSNEEILTWYKNMLTGTRPSSRDNGCA